MKSNPHSPKPLPFQQMKPTATPQGSPAPPEQSSPKSGATKRPRMAPALSDITNLLLPETPTPIKPRRSARRPLPQTSEASSTCSSSASVTPAPKRPSAAVLEEECSAAKSPAISTVYARRGTTEGTGRKEAPSTSKGKSKAKVTTTTAAVGTASCPHLGKSTRDNNRKSSLAQETRPISSSAPCHEAKRKRRSSSTTKLSEDFVKEMEEKRAYYADVDAYKLDVEEVSEADLD